MIWILLYALIGLLVSSHESYSGGTEGYVLFSFCLWPAVVLVYGLDGFNKLMTRFWRWVYLKLGDSD